ncbi:MAG: M28 family peptidase [Anaerolineae bacterium]
MDNAAGAWQHMQRLAQTIGPRPVGSPAHRAAAAYIEEQMTRAGLTVRRQVWDCPDWRCEETRLVQDAVALPAAANWYAPSCAVSGPLVTAETLDELAAKDLGGRIVLLHGALTQGDVAARGSVVYYPEESRSLNELLDAHPPAAVIAVAMRIGSLRRVFSDRQMAFPSVTVPAEVGAHLLRHRDVPVSLLIRSETTPGQGWNVIGERPGRRSERVVVSAHYDTVLDTPGAIDNASGVSAMLTVAEMLSGEDLACGLEFAAFGAEECGWYSLYAYLEPYGLQPIATPWGQDVGEVSEAWLPILANVNMDGIGELLGPTNVAVIAGSDDLAALVRDLREARHPGIIPSAPWPASDHHMFYSHGVPALALNCVGVSHFTNHQPSDTLAWASRDRLAEAAAFVADTVRALQDKDSTWTRPPQAT